MTTTTSPEPTFTEFEVQQRENDKFAGQISRAARRVLLAGLFGLTLGLALATSAEYLEPEHLAGDSEITNGIHQELVRSLETLPSHEGNSVHYLRMVEHIDKILTDKLHARANAPSRPKRLFLTAMREIGMGLIVAAFAVFGYELLRHVSGSVREAKLLHHGYNSLDRATHDMAKLIHRIRPVVGVPTEVAEGVTSALESSASSKACIERYHVEYELGRLHENGYREIRVSYSYQPLTPLVGGKLRLRCTLSLTKNDISPDVIGLPGYDLSWVFLGHASDDLSELPPDALSGIEVILKKQGGRTERLKVTKAASSTAGCLEFETDKEVDDLNRLDVLIVSFVVLQSDDFSFVSDRVTECVLDYTARCVVGADALDIMGVFPGEFLCGSADTRVDASNLRRVSVVSQGWVLPKGGVTFSWKQKRKASDLQLVRELRLPGNSNQEGTFFHLGAASEVARAVVERLRTAKEALNTFIVWDLPYSQEVNDGVEDAIRTFVQRKDVRFEETCSPLGKKRVSNLARTLGGTLPDCYQVRVLKPGANAVPACNFIIIRHGDNGPTREEVFFGWGYFRGSSNESVFWSCDSALIAFFRDYHRALRSAEVSEEYTA